MKLRCRLEPIALRLHRPLQTARGAIHARTGWILQVSGSGGHHGRGEATPLPAFGGEDPATCERALRGWLETAPRLPRIGWFDPAWEPLFADAPCARSAVESACCELLARRLGIRSAQLLSHQARRRLPVNALASNRGDLHRARRNGITVVKVKADEQIDVTAERLYEWSVDFPGMRWRVDANGSWSPALLERFLRLTTPHRIDHIEQPLPYDAWRQQATCALQSAVPLALDESLRRAHDIARMVRCRAAQRAVLKPQLLGGWEPTARYAAICARHGIEVVVTTALEGAIGRSWVAQIAAACARPSVAHGLSTGHLITDEEHHDGCTIGDGQLLLPVGRGHGWH